MMHVDWIIGKPRFLKIIEGKWMESHDFDVVGLPVALKYIQKYKSPSN